MMHDEFRQLSSIPQVPAIIQKKTKGKNMNFLIFGILIGLVLTLGYFTISFSQGSIVSNETLYNDTTNAYLLGINDGVIFSANYTTVTGNYTYIDNGEVKSASILAICQNLNNNGGNK